MLGAALSLSGGVGVAAATNVLLGAAGGILLLGPGAGIAPSHRRLFNPDRFRCVLFDQRGSGQSRPFATIESNTTELLIRDIEVLRQHLGIEKFILFGGSWGSTLALAYAIAYPEHVESFILRGIFLGTADEVSWFLHDMGRFFPEAHE